MANLPDIGASSRERENGCGKKIAAPPATCVGEWIVLVMKPVCEAHLVECGKVFVSLSDTFIAAGHIDSSPCARVREKQQATRIHTEKHRNIPTLGPLPFPQFSGLCVVMLGQHRARFPLLLRRESATQIRGQPQVQQGDYSRNIPRESTGRNQAL